MVVEKFSDGAVLYDHELNNKQTFHNDTTIRKNGQVKVYVQILSSGDSPKVRLYLYGEAGEAGVLQHDHSTHTHTTTYESTDGTAYNAGAAKTFEGKTTTATQVGTAGTQTPISTSDVPQAVQIWIDGTEYTATIGDPNSKGATMYDSTNDDWGVDGTTEWNTGELDLSGVISWTVGEHYIEFKETGGTGGRILYNLYVN